MASIMNRRAPFGNTGVDGPAVKVAGPRLKASALTLWDSTVMAIASTAPAYSLAATMFVMTQAVGLASPATILVSFVPVLGIALAYFYMNRTNPNCGASYAWLTQAMSPFMGWFTGWAQIATSVFFLVSAPVTAGQNTMAFLNSLGWVSSATASSTVWITAVAIAWSLFIAVIVILGVQLAARFQTLLLGIEYTVVVAFSLLALYKVATLHPRGSQLVSWSWFNPLSIHGISGLAAGSVIAVFFFWGWDTASNVNEETKNAHLTPGRAGVISMFLLLFIFLLSSTAMQALLPQQTIVDQGGNALQYFANQVLPAPWSYLMLLAILSSTVAVAQTTLLPATRITYAMARDRVFPRLFSRLSARFQTPLIGTVVITALCIVGLLFSTISPSANQTLTYLNNDTGVLVSFYYGITGIGCAWYFRRILFRSARTLVLTGILPLLSGLFLFWVGYQVVLQNQQGNGWGSVLPVLFFFVIGIPLVMVAWLFNRRYFSYRARAYTAGQEDLPIGTIMGATDG